MSHASRIRVAVLRGGPSHDYDASLRTGARVLAVLKQMPDKYEPVDVFISRDGTWHYWGVSREPERALKHVDVVWNGLHGPYGEDGQVQEILEALGLPFTGSGRESSVRAMNKEQAKKLFRMSGLHVPQHEMITQESLSPEILLHIFRTYVQPVVVKPSNLSGSIGIRKAYSYKELEEAILESLNHSPNVLVEEMIRGKEASCGVLEGGRGEKLYAFIPVEISGREYKAPGSFGSKKSKEIENMARLAHEALGMRHYSMSDFVISPSGKIYILETNSLPHLHEQSLINKSFEAGGWQAQEFVDHCIGLAMNR